MGGSVPTELITAPVLVSPHGFTTRRGGVSTGPYRSLNLSPGVGDDPDRVAENRRRVLALFGHPPLAELDQEHGARVAVVRAPGRYPGDALVTDRPGLLLRVSAADCYPVLLEDPATGAVAAAHAGWRGVAAGVVENVVGALAKVAGAPPDRLAVAIGPGICGGCYQVGPEVIAAVARAGLPETWRPDPRDQGRYLLDLQAAIVARLRSLGVTRIWASHRCTFEDEELFSYRRQGPKSGRMWGLIQRGAA